MAQTRLSIGYPKAAKQTLSLTKERYKNSTAPPSPWTSIPKTQIIEVPYMFQHSRLLRLLFGTGGSFRLTSNVVRTSTGLEFTTQLSHLGTVRSTAERSDPIRCRPRPCMESGVLRSLLRSCPGYESKTFSLGT